MGTGTPTPITYDPTGNTVSDGTNHFTYDGRNRLIQVSNAQGLAYYAINGLGQRVAKLSGAPPDLAGDANHDGVLNTTDLRLIGLMILHQIPVDLAADCNHDGQITLADAACVSAKIINMRLNPQQYVSPTGTTFAYDEAGHLIGEYSAAGSTETVYLGDTPVAVIKGGAVYYLYADHLDAPRLIINNANAPVWNWEGAPFGNTPANADPGSTGTPFTYNLRFPGQYYDAETGLHYNNARDYSPSTGRYIESDPIGLQGGLSSYAYAESSPTTTWDFLGTAGFKYLSQEGIENAVAAAAAESAHSEPAPGDTQTVYPEEPGPLGTATCAVKPPQHFVWDPRYGWVNPEYFKDAPVAPSNQSQPVPSKPANQPGPRPYPAVIGTRG